VVEETSKNNSNDSPPIFKTWGRLYALVFFNLVFLVILFYFFTKAFE
jgi:hypothetical protein